MKRVFLACLLWAIICGLLSGCGHTHEWLDASCTTPKTCTECSETEGEPLGHSWNEATCTSPKTCSRCNATEGEAIGHDWKDATCTDAKICSRCGFTEGDPLGHEWIEATCTEPKTCSRCGITEGETLGHDTTGVTCTEAVNCSRCGVEIPALGHEWVDATCTEPKTCSRCGLTEGEALDHTPAEPKEANKKAATCTEDGSYDLVVVCSVCGEELSREPKTEAALGHTPADPKVENKKAATCTEDGSYDEVVYCSKCRAELSRKTKTEAALGHTTTSGKCSRCGLEIYEPITGRGDDVISDISVGDGLYKVHFTNSGSRNFVVWVYDKNDDRDLAVNEIGSYDGYYFLIGEGPYTFEVESSGNWSITIEPLGTTTSTSFSGKGSYVTDIFSASAGTWHITHKGSHNFVIWLYTTEGRDLIVNEIGNYDGRKRMSIPSGSNAIIVIEADGAWTIEPAN